MTMRRVHGYTLIEILITVALIGTIALIAVPVTGSWVREANIEEAHGQLTQAIGRAKASGLRNLPSATGSEFVSIVCVDTTNNALKVMESTSSTPASCAAGNAANKLWEANLKDEITVLDSTNNAINCLCFNNKGIPVTPAGGACASCYVGSDFKISAGSKTETLTIF